MLPEAWPKASSSQHPRGPLLGACSPQSEASDLGSFEVVQRVPLRVKQWEVLAGGTLRLHKRAVRWESRCGSVLVLSSTASESCPCLSHPRSPATLAKAPRDRKRRLGLPGRSMSWLQNWRPAFTAAFTSHPGAISGSSRGG